MIVCDENEQLLNYNAGLIFNVLHTAPRRWSDGVSIITSLVELF